MMTAKDFIVLCVSREAIKSFSRLQEKKTHKNNTIKSVQENPNKHSRCYLLFYPSGNLDT